MGTSTSNTQPRQPGFFNVSDVGKAGNDISGAQRDKDDAEDDAGHGAAMLSVKSHVKL